MGRVSLPIDTPGLWVDFETVSTSLLRQISKRYLLKFLREHGFLNKKNKPYAEQVKMGFIKIEPPMVDELGEFQGETIYLAGKTLKLIIEYLSSNNRS